MMVLSWKELSTSLFTRNSLMAVSYFPTISWKRDSAGVAHISATASLVKTRAAGMVKFSGHTGGCHVQKYRQLSSRRWLQLKGNF